MVTLGVDAHKRSHTIVAVDEAGRQLAVRTIGTTTLVPLDHTRTRAPDRFKGAQATSPTPRVMDRGNASANARWRRQSLQP